MNKPNFFIVGAPKCGTTALYTYLKRHPEIFMSSIKEPHFFAEDVLGDHRSIRTREDYLSCFAAARHEKRIGEASSTYLGSRLAPAEIKTFNPAARIIIMLRNPVDMMHALHGERLFDLEEHLVSFEAALDADERRNSVVGASQGQNGFGLSYREAASFARQVRRYFEAFGRENVHIIIYDDFKKDTDAVYKETLRFLGVRLDVQPEFQVIHSNRRVRSKSLHKFLISPPRAVRRVIHSVTSLPLRRFLGGCFNRLNVVYEPRPPMNPEFRSRLQKKFEPEVEELSALLGMDLSAWSEASAGGARLGGK